MQRLKLTLIRVSVLSNKNYALKNEDLKKKDDLPSEDILANVFSKEGLVVIYASGKDQKRRFHYRTLIGL